MSAQLQAFVDGFVLPLLGGGALGVNAPLSTRDRDQMAAGGASVLLSASLDHARHQRARLLVAAPDLPQPGVDELSLWLGLHNMLFFDHPDVGRVWARGSKWQGVEHETHALLEYARPTELKTMLATHVAVGAFLQLRRLDRIVRTSEGERRYLGQDVRRRIAFFGASLGEDREEVVDWIAQPHAKPTARLMTVVFSISPLTALLRPELAPPGWSPLAGAGFLRAPAYARAVVHQWARNLDWVSLGALVVGSLARDLDLMPELAVAAAPGPGVYEPERDDVGPAAEGARPMAALPAPATAAELAGPVEIGSVVGALIHLHVLKLLELDARVGLVHGTRDRAVQAFLALPLLLPHLEPALGSPFAAQLDASFSRRWTEYTEHLRGLVPREVVENLLATLVPRIVEKVPA